MTKMDALNQQTLMRCFRALKDFNIGLIDSTEIPTILQCIQSDYMENMILILEEVIDEQR